MPEAVIAFVVALIAVHVVLTLARALFMPPLRRLLRGSWGLSTEEAIEAARAHYQDNGYHWPGASGVRQGVWKHRVVLVCKPYSFVDVDTITGVVTKTGGGSR